MLILSVPNIDEHVVHVWNEDDEFKKGDRALLVHGVESDWLEEEMMEDDEEFIRNEIDHKIIKSHV